jgi:hypothetical protein
MTINYAPPDDLISITLSLKERDLIFSCATIDDEFINPVKKSKISKNNIVVKFKLDDLNLFIDQLTSEAHTAEDSEDLTRAMRLHKIALKLIGDIKNFIENRLNDLAKKKSNLIKMSNCKRIN